MFISLHFEFDNIAKNCAALAKALASLDIKMESKFGSYGPNNKINETSLTKVKTFMGNSPNNPPSANNAPTRGAILSKILREIKELVKTRRNRNRNVSGNNIKTPRNFNEAIVRLINAVNEAKGSAPGNAPAA